MRFVLALILFPLLSSGQHKSVSFELVNEIGTYKLVSLTFAHELDNQEGITYVIHNRDGDTIYHLDQFLNGWVGLSNNGQTIAHLITEKNKEPLDKSILFMYRGGIKFDGAEMDRLVSYELQLTKVRNRLPKSGWLRNDSLYHKMAEHPFYITDDKLFISFDEPKLAVFDMNKMFHIFSGNGANHFHKNYYSLPNPPLRSEMDAEEYFPNGFPKTIKGKAFIQAMASDLRKSTAIPEEAKYRAEVEIKLKTDGSFDLRHAVVYSIISNNKEEELSKQLKSFVENIEFDDSMIPPQHPAWIFDQIYWLK